MTEWLGWQWELENKGLLVICILSDLSGNLCSDSHMMALCIWIDDSLWGKTRGKEENSVLEQCKKRAYYAIFSENGL